MWFPSTCYYFQWIPVFPLVFMCLLGFPWHSLWFLGFPVISDFPLPTRFLAFPIFFLVSWCFLLSSVRSVPSVSSFCHSGFLGSIRLSGFPLASGFTSDLQSSHCVLAFPVVSWLPCTCSLSRGFLFSHWPLVFPEHLLFPMVCWFPSGL